MNKILLKQGYYEPYAVSTQAKFIKEGDVVLNIGCHYGLEAIVFGKIIGPKGKLILFEPYIKSYKSLMKSIYLNNLEGIATLYNIAAGNQNKDGYIFVEAGHTSASQIYTDENI